jgi:hypothetical protein
MFFADNTKRHTYAQIYNIQQFLNQPTPLLPVACPHLYDFTPLFTYLENQLLLLVV